MRIVSLIFIFLTISVSVWGQGKKSYEVQIELSGIGKEKDKNKLEKLLRNATDSLDFVKRLDTWIRTKQDAGFLEYTIDSKFTKSHNSATPNWALHISEGAYYYYQAIRLEGINEQYPQRLGIDRLAKKQAHVNWRDIEHKLKACLDLYQNEGYPFASFSQLEIVYEGKRSSVPKANDRRKSEKATDSIGVSLTYAFDPGSLVIIDSVKIKGKIREKSNFVQAVSGVSTGDIYRQKSLEDIPRVLNNSIYYENVKEPNVTFRPDNKVDLVLELEPKETSKLDLLIGILPPNENTERLQFTGSIDIALLSSFRKGELLEFTYDKLTENSAQTHFKVMFPYILRTPLRVSAALNLLRQNEEFQNQSLDVSAEYAFSPFLSASFFLNNRSTRLLGDALTDSTLTEIPQLDANRRTLGIGLHFDNLDYRLNPSRGLSTYVKIGLGNRSIRENVLISRTRPDFYENIEPEQASREIDFSVKWYQQLIPRHVLHIANHTYWLDLKDVFRNDQLQVGGSRSIRGFNENEFFTDFYSFFSLEYRLQLERNSYIFLFGDYAYMENQEAGTILHPMSTGLGMNYGTKAGIISISYAIGRSEVLPFQPSRGRVHIGLINQF